MKIFITNFIIGATLTAVSLGSAATAAADSTSGIITHSLVFSPESVTSKVTTASDGKEYIKVSAPDCSEFGEPGDISLPYRFVNFIVPASTNGFSVSITSSEESAKSIDASNNPYPIQESQKTDGSPAPDFTPLKNTSGIASEYSPKVAQEYVVNGNAHIVTMAIPLGKFSADSKRINLYKSAQISLSYNICESSKLPFTIMSAPSTELDIDVTEMVLNKDNVTNYAPASRKQLKARYYILTPEYLEPYVHDIAGWKRQKGFDVTVKTYEDIAADHTCDVVDSEESVDKEAHLRNWLKNERKKYGTFYLLLIGDERAGAPIRKYRDAPVTSGHPEYEIYNGRYFIPTDSYFSDLTSKFNLTLQENGYYSALASRLFYSPLIPVGRILSYKPEHLENYFHKMLVYECDPGFGDTDYLNNGLITKQADMFDDPTIFSEFSSLTELTTMQDCQMNDSFETNRPTGEQVLNEFRNKALISLHGHGAPYAIAVSGKSVQDSINPENNRSHLVYRYIKAKEAYTKAITFMNNHEHNSGIDLYNNFDKPYIVYSISCDVTPFDEIYNFAFSFPTDYLNMGQSFTIGGLYGTPCFIGNTRIGHSPHGNWLESKFGRELNKGYSIGKAFVSSQYPITTNRIGYYREKYVRSLIGSPDIYLWRGKPDEYDVSFKIADSQIYLSGKDLSDSQISFYDGCQKNLLSAIPNESHDIVINSNYLGFGNDFAITLSKFNRIPITIIFANHTTISSLHKTYYVNCAEIRNPFDSKTHCFEIKDSGILEIKATRNVRTIHAFNVGNRGTLKISNIAGETRLSRDNVASGGKLQICSKETVLDSGFLIEKGGELEIRNY